MQFKLVQKKLLKTLIKTVVQTLSRTIRVGIVITAVEFSRTNVERFVWIAKAKEKSG
jgi:hypothetical protein